MNTMADKNSILCPSCKTRTNLIQRIKYVWPEDSNTIFEISECNGCNTFFLVKRRGGTITGLWPKELPQIVDDRIPEHIREDFNEANLCFSVEANRAAAVMARRSLQNICLDKSADKDKKLEQQIDELQEMGIITKDLQNWAHEVRHVGNDGAHPGKDEPVKREDAQDITELLTQFCNVLYIAPSIADERRKLREESKTQGQ